MPTKKGAIVTKDSKAVIHHKFQCGRCHFWADEGFLTFRDRDHMDYIYEDSPDGYRSLTEDRREYLYVCYDCDWKLMNGYGMEYDELED